FRFPLSSLFLLGLRLLRTRTRQSEKRAGNNHLSKTLHGFLLLRFNRRFRLPSRPAALSGRWDTSSADDNSHTPYRYCRSPEMTRLCPSRPPPSKPERRHPEVSGRVE